jgi:hypothetical protein
MPRVKTQGDRKPHPAILEAPGVIHAQGGLLDGHAPFSAGLDRGGHQAQLRHELEAVADAEHQVARVDEATQLIHELVAALGDPGVAPADGRGLGRPEVVTVEESAG